MFWNCSWSSVAFGRVTAAPSAASTRYARPLRIAAVALAICAAAALPAAAQPQPVAGQNINMVSGTTFPGGDPFLQRQNEPSLAVSSRNALHLLAGANDYRTVDLPVSDTVPGSLAGDAWLGVFKSFDGGLSWQSYLLPGYPQDNSPAGLASPLKAYSAAADPTVRAGVGGVFYYSGIAFNRGTNNGAVFVSTFFDANSKENGNAPEGSDTIPYQGTVVVDTGTSGQFLDKTWIAVDIPRAGSGTCTFPGQSQLVPAGNVYLAWSRFTGSQSTKIMFTRSRDCGKTWSNPAKLSESSSINQGTNIAIDPVSGSVYVVWRQFATSSNADSILVARSDDFGNTFPNKNTMQVATIAPFDQALSSTRFRTNALPSVAVSVDGGGTSRVHVAWAQRDATSQDAQVVVSTLSSNGKTWSTPAAVDAGPLTDDSQTGQTFGRGHQFMPQMTFAAGRLMVLYYDQRLDHTLGLFKPVENLVGNPPVPTFLGVYQRTQALRGELLSPGGTGQVFKLFIDDDAAVLAVRRHTIDLRVAEALPAASPVFKSASVSQYRMGLWAPDENDQYRDDENELINPAQPSKPDKLFQLQVNAPNLPMFSLGTLPFLGDYIDIAGQTFVTDDQGNWVFNTSSSNPPVFYATWTDNRDVVPPVVPNSGGRVDWTKYTPPISEANPAAQHASIIDPTQMVPVCQDAFTGSRNQNIYFSRITEGLLVGSPQDAKPLSATFQRAFVVTMQNQTNQDRTFTLTLTAEAGVWASFLQAPSPAVPGQPLSTLTVTIPARSGAARPVFAFSSTKPAGRMKVSVVESVSNGLSGSIVLNPEGSVSPLAQPDDTDPTNANIGSLEIYTPTFQVWSDDPKTNPNPYVNISSPGAAIQNISNQNISNQNISNADPAIQNISNQNISNQNISNQNISNQNISNPSPAIQNISNQNISNQNISNTTAANQNISNQNISNQNISNQNISNTPITDATYAMTNVGNTTHSYRVALYGTNSSGKPLQVIVTKNSSTPVAVGCTLQSLPQSSVLARADRVPIAESLTGTGSATDPNIPDPNTSNTTVSIGPGETVFVTLRGALSPQEMAALTRQLTPVVTAHGANTNGAVEFAALLFIKTTGSTTLPDAIVGVPYGPTTLQASGGKTPLTWSRSSGALPDGLTLSPAGTISGTPTGSGGSGLKTFEVQVADSTLPTNQMAKETFSLTVNKAATTTAIAPLSPSVFGQSVTFTATVSVTAPGTGSPSGEVTFKDGDTTLGTGTLNAGVATFSTSSLSVAAHPIAAFYGGDTSFNASSSPVVSQVVDKAASTTALLATPNPSTFGQSITFTATVTGPGGTPTGSVSFLDGATSFGTGTLNAGGVATFSTSSLLTSPHSITASYSGDTSFKVSTSSAVSQVVDKATSTTALLATPNPSTFGGSVTFTATVTGPGGTPGGTVTFLDGGTSIGTGTLNAGGVATLSISTLPVATHTITASYAGNTSFNASTSPAVSQEVNKAASTTALLATPNPSSFGGSVTFTATVTGPGGTPGGTVTFLDGGTSIGTGTLNAGGVATLSISTLSVATHSITASYGGDTSFNVSTSPVVSQVVNNGTSATALVATPNPSSFAQSVTFMATVTGPGGTPTGTVSFKDGAVTIGAGTLNAGVATFATSSLSVGTHTITASYGGDTSFNGSASAAVPQVVNKAASATALSAVPNPSTFGQSVVFTAMVSGPGGTPGGSVTFNDGATALGTITLNSGVATVSTSSLSVGPHSITATYSGETSFNGSISPAVSQVVNKATSAAVLASAPNPSTSGQSVTLTATVAGPGGTPTGTVTFLDGTTTVGTGTLSGGRATFTTSGLAVGSHTITASYSGDTSFGASTSGALTQIVNVPPFTFVGFQTPLVTAGTFSSPSKSPSSNLGSAVPIKWQLFNASGANVTDLTSTTSLYAIVNTACSGQPTGTQILLYSPTSGAKGGSTFRSSTSGFIFNWDTSTSLPTGKGCYTIVLQLSDGTPQKATTLQLK